MPATAAVTAASGPTIAALAASSCATSADCWRADAPATARSQPTIVTWSFLSATRCAVSRRPWATPAPCSRVVCAHASSSEHASTGCPRTSAVTSNASGPRAPAARTVGARTPDSRARRIVYASYSTCWRRVGKKAGGASRYAIHRQMRAISCASASSRPMATIRSGPVSPSARNTARATDWSSASRTFLHGTLKADIARVVCSTVGRRAAVPNARCTTAATPQPRTIAATTSAGRDRPRYMDASARRSTIDWPTRRVGRAR